MYEYTRMKISYHRATKNYTEHQNAKIECSSSHLRAHPQEHSGVTIQKHHIFVAKVLLLEVEDFLWYRFSRENLGRCHVMALLVNVEISSVYYHFTHLDFERPGGIGALEEARVSGSHLALLDGAVLRLTYSDTIK